MNRKIAVLAVATFLMLLPYLYSFPSTSDVSYKITEIEEEDSILPLRLGTRSGDITFTNVTDEVGLSGLRGDSYAWGDFNNDGFLDLLAKDHVNGKSHLFKNSGPPHWVFSDVTEEAGLEGAGYAVWGDYNNDGYLDFFSVGHTNTNPDNSWDTLWMNQGPPDYTFLNVTESAGNLNDGMPGLAAGWADYDRDGFLDLYIVNWRDLDNNRYPDVLYQNNGDGTFTDVTVEAGVWEGDDPYAGMGMNWGDYNNDGWPDIYVSNYLVTPNYLYENDGDGTFSEVAHDKNAAGLAYSPSGGYYGHTAGSSWADYDHDGDLDMWVSNLAHTTDPRGFYTDYSEMLRNNGPPDYDFTDVRDETGIEKKPYMSEDELHFGIAWGDYDNDGDYDMFIPQIKDLDYAYSYFFENNGDGTFTDVSEEVGVRVWHTDGGCWADYNNDGYIDLITEGKYPYENGTYGVRLFRNDGGNTNNWLKVELKASECNLASIGARVKVTGNGITQMKEVEGGTAGHAYQHSMVQHFGFGDYDGPVEVKVWWPSGNEGILKDVSLNQMITVYENTDLTVSKISFSDQDPEEGDMVRITATIQNVGHVKASHAKINFYDGSITTDPIDTEYISTIEPGNQKYAQVDWDTTDKIGSHEIIVLIEEVVPEELDDQNNMANESIVVKAASQTPGQPPGPSEPQNHPPVINEFTAEPSSVLLGGQCTLTVDAEDIDGDVLTFTYQSTDGNIVGTGNVVTWNAPGNEGVFEIKVTVKDTNNAEDEASANVEVKANAPPNIKGFQVTPDSVLSNGIDKILFTAEISDENGLVDIDEVIIDLSPIGGSSTQGMRDDGTKGDSEAADGIFSYETEVLEGIESGEKRIKITVKDESGRENFEEVALLVISTEGQEDEQEFPLFYLVLFSLFLVVIVVVAVSILVGKRNKARYH